MTRKTKIIEKEHLCASTYQIVKAELMLQREPIANISSDVTFTMKMVEKHEIQRTPN